MASKLGIYNLALQIMGERTLSSLTENRPARYKLDTVWDSGLVNSVAEDADWNCFMVSAQIDKDESATPSFGYDNAFTKPTDMLKISGVWHDERMQTPLEYYVDEGDNFFSDLDTIYIRYVPDNVIDSVASWPVYFSNLVAAELAKVVAGQLKTSNEYDRVLGQWRMYERTAKSKDAMRAPSKKLPLGNWIQSRASRYGRDRYSGGQ